MIVFRDNEVLSRLGREDINDSVPDNANSQKIHKNLDKSVFKQFKKPSAIAKYESDSKKHVLKAKYESYRKNPWFYENSGSPLKRRAIPKPRKYSFSEMPFKSELLV